MKRWRDWLLYAEAAVLTILMAAALLSNICSMVRSVRGGPWFR